MASKKASKTGSTARKAGKTKDLAPRERQAKSVVGGRRVMADTPVRANTSVGSRASLI